jgi:hypothetical protein
MGFGLFVLAVTAVFSALAIVMNRNGRKADRERRGY